MVMSSFRDGILSWQLQMQKAEEEARQRRERTPERKTKILPKEEKGVTRQGVEDCLALLEDRSPREAAPSPEPFGPEALTPEGKLVAKKRKVE